MCVIAINGCARFIIHADENDIIMGVHAIQCGWGSNGAAEAGEGSVSSISKGMQGMARCARPLCASSERERSSKCEHSSVQFYSNDEPLYCKIPKSK
jgi:hypothetical protein